MIGNKKKVNLERERAWFEMKKKHQQNQVVRIIKRKKSNLVGDGAFPISIIVIVEWTCNKS